MDQLPIRPTWVEIDGDALANNVREIRRLIGRRCLLAGVVKANAYGHGAVAVARRILAAGADRLAVATLSEALELRDAGVDAPILVLGYTPTWQAGEGVRRRITATVFDLEMAQALAAAGAAQGVPAQAHVKINTGMNRLGILPAEAPAFLRALQEYSALHVEGLFTHFATSDTDLAFAHVQTARFCCAAGGAGGGGAAPACGACRQLRRHADAARNALGHGALRHCALRLGPGRGTDAAAAQLPARAGVEGAGGGGHFAAGGRGRELWVGVCDTAPVDAGGDPARLC